MLTRECSLRLPLKPNGWCFNSLTDSRGSSFQFAWQMGSGVTAMTADLRVLQRRVFVLRRNGAGHARPTKSALGRNSATAVPYRSAFKGLHSLKMFSMRANHWVWARWNLTSAAIVAGNALTILPS